MVVPSPSFVLLISASLTIKPSVSWPPLKRTLDFQKWERQQVTNPPISSVWSGYFPRLPVPKELGRVSPRWGSRCQVGCDYSSLAPLQTRPHLMEACSHTKEAQSHRSNTSCFYMGVLAWGPWRDFRRSEFHVFVLCLFNTNVLLLIYYIIF